MSTRIKRKQAQRYRTWRELTRTQRHERARRAALPVPPLPTCFESTDEQEHRGAWLKQREELAVNLVKWASNPPAHNAK